MKKQLLFLPLAALLVSMVAPKIMWEYKKADVEDGNISYKLNIPWVTGPDATVAEKINKEITDQVKEIDDPFKDHKKRTYRDFTFDQLLAMIKETMSKDALGRSLELEYDVNGDAYQRGDIITIYMKQFSFTGGAHPNTYLSLQNFDVNTGKELYVSDFVTDTTALKQMLIKRFTKMRGYKGHESMGSTGLFMELDDLPMPINIGFTKRGLTAIYNTYEVAPYSYGPTYIYIPFKELGGILKPVN